MFNKERLIKWGELAPSLQAKFTDLEAKIDKEIQDRIEWGNTVEDDLDKTVKDLNSKFDKFESNVNDKISNISNNITNVINDVPIPIDGFNQIVGIPLPDGSQCTHSGLGSKRISISDQCYFGADPLLGIDQCHQCVPISSMGTLLIGCIKNITMVHLV